MRLIPRLRVNKAPKRFMTLTPAKQVPAPTMKFPSLPTLPKLTRLPPQPADWANGCVVFCRHVQKMFVSCNF